MSSFFWITYSLLWLLVAALLLLVLLLYRQYGLMLMPGRRRVELGGLDLGSHAPEIPVEFRGSSDPPILTWDRTAPSDTFAGWIVLFSSPHCPICKRLWEEEELDQAALAWPQLEFVWVDAEPRADEHRPAHWRVALSPDETANQAMEVPAYPFAFAIEAGGIIRAKGLVNDLDDLQRVADMGFPAQSPRAIRDEPAKAP
jgi:hypothetical protein